MANWLPVVSPCPVLKEIEGVILISSMLAASREVVSFRAGWDVRNPFIEVLLNKRDLF
jgi:hypothetical protein